MKDSLRVAWVHRYLIKSKCFWSVKATALSSGFWRRLLKLRGMARGLLRHKVGLGVCTSLWLDYWLPNGPISSQIGLTVLEILQMDYQVKVDSLISNFQWTIPSSLQQNYFFQSKHFLSQLHSLPDPTPTQDVIQWLPSAPRDYSHRLTRDYFTPPSLLFSCSHLIWFKHHIPKHGRIAWLALRHRLYTLDSKPMRHKHKTNACYLCLAGWESLDHLFFQCKFSRVILEFMQHAAGFYILPNNWTELMHCVVC
ncbi:uncharacterized protein LOC132278053 [Cornus florida]|uniref:uncharacterized protein LOC132278053 n=1 Tax=Cornus florida TaxID=4283 RepID=UPI00289EA6B9|nr:uncharacterized protein LOC132278053 [Cornus florida]